MARTLAMVGMGAALGAALVWVLPASAQGADCYSRRRTPTLAAICNDTQLSRSDQQVVRRVATLSRQMTFGQYLGLRYWRDASDEDRGSRCGADRTCIAASYRAQMRFLDRLQFCLDTSPRRRACLRDTLNLDREALRR